MILPRLRLFCLTAAVSLCVSTLAVPTGSSASLSASQTGAQLLQAQLPAETGLPQATYEQLTRAVGLATRAHRGDAVAILHAALTRGDRKDPRAADAKLNCSRVAGLVHVAVAAAPEKASSLLELAGSLYPDCADALQTAVELFDSKNVVDDKNGPVGAYPSAANPLMVSNGNADPNDLNLDDPQVRDINSVVGGFDPGFSNGFGPGFPGAPGFVGSPPTGSVALPSPIAPAVTPVVNG